MELRAHHWHQVLLRVEELHARAEMECDDTSGEGQLPGDHD